MIRGQKTEIIRLSAVSYTHLELKRDIENQDMAFMCDDCTNGVTLVMDVERHSDVDVIIMRYTAIKDIETYIAQIRAITKTARILLILSGLRKQYVQTQFDVYRKQYNVEDIIFEGKGMDTVSYTHLDVYKRQVLYTYDEVENNYD